MSINGTTKICATIGNPVEHSLSPVMHNAAYEEMGLNFVFLACKVLDVKKALDGVRGLNFRGLSVTMPHKIEAMKYLDDIDETAQKIGAINTIVNDNGKLKGYNTDYAGTTLALLEKTKIKGKNVVLLGAGGAARAIAFGLKKEGANITIINRTKDKASGLAKFIDAKVDDLSNIIKIKVDILINATSLGMDPNVNISAMPQEYFRKNMTVFDIVYRPKETKFLREARESGCQIVYGYKMLLYQAVAQFELFTQKKAPVAIMEKALLDALERKN